MRPIAALLAVTFALAQASCIGIGYSSRGGFFFWPGGLGILVVVAVVLLLARRRR